MNRVRNVITIEVSDDENDDTHELCSICYDENNNRLSRIKCESCKFECCNICYNKIESNSCPICKFPQFKQSHIETISPSEVEFFEDIVNQLQIIVSHEYELRMFALMTTINKLKKEIQSKDKIINEYQNNKIICDCGKHIQKRNYAKHCNSKRHVDYCNNL